MGSPGISSLGVQKKELKKQKRKKGLLKKIVDYLKSDSYMFAPLVSPQVSSDFLPPKNTLHISSTDETMKPSEEKNKKLHEKAGDYLMSDSHMYAQLIGPQQSHGLVDADTSGPYSAFNKLEKVLMKKMEATEVTTMKISKKTSQPTESTVKVFGGDESSENIRLKSHIALQTTAAVEHIVHQHCRSFIPGKWGLGLEQRKLVVE